ncbi:adenosylcobinamide amidohydrolase [Propionispora hippei]|uniref:Adenosylcobinamide amidohydrolase n=1 Tax=Propionispora hippei DSM 15287 TaxID=1123003 RepID=A0A1M6KYN8_9FIRM|nr:adenosylcobinamide amidohydrolase [Propionispora hippei]SHJ64004.1 Adenosylcobinamide amidohydrolase [Propionispora hippei DSM 15287]
MKIYELSNGDPVYRPEKSIIIRFKWPRKVLSTSIYNGGYRNDLTAVFNYDCTVPNGKCTWQAANYEEYMRQAAVKFGLTPDTVSGMATAAAMDNVAIHTACYQSLQVTALVTGGIEENGGRVGDPATYFEPAERNTLYKPGTINIFLVIDADMPPASLVRALVTCTEAKTAALQELMAGSNYSTGLATGSGTDQTMLIANPHSALYLESAGKHAKLGELIGCVVKQAVKEALQRQTGLSPKLQYSSLRRLKRFGVGEETLWTLYRQETGDADQVWFLQRLRCLDTNSRLVIYTSLYVHLLDQWLWGLLNPEEVRRTGQELIEQVSSRIGVYPPQIGGENLEDYLTAWSSLVVAAVNKTESCDSQPAPVSLFND